jgi:membrane-bound inhibitor of C-type lysozyme
MRCFTIVATIAMAFATGCQRDEGSAVPAGEAVDSPPPAAPAAPDATSATEPLVLRWECDGGTALTTKYLARDEAISLGMHEGERKLPRVISASGDKYQDGPITFWRKGDEAFYERAPAPPVNCRLATGNH